MNKFIFLDNWVFSRLLDPSFYSHLSAFIEQRNYTVLVTSTLLAELYNSKWQEAGDRDRGLNAVSFISDHESVIVDPKKVYDTEYLHFPKNLNVIPVELDLKTIKDELRLETLLRLLRRDPLFLSQGKDIEMWSDSLKESKRTWLNVAKEIIEHGLQNGTLKQNKRGEFIVDTKSKEVALTSLDLRIFDGANIQAFLDNRLYRK